MRAHKRQFEWNPNEEKNGHRKYSQRLALRVDTVWRWQKRVRRERKKKMKNNKINKHYHALAIRTFCSATAHGPKQRDIKVGKRNRNEDEEMFWCFVWMLLLHFHDSVVYVPFLRASGAIKIRCVTRSPNMSNSSFILYGILFVPIKTDTDWSTR